jgi:hypothetical protein
VSCPSPHQTSKQATCGAKRRRYDPAILEEQIDGSKAATTQIRELTDQARFDLGSARAAPVPGVALARTKQDCRSALETQKQGNREAKPRHDDLAILEEQIDGRTAATTQTKDLTDQARFDHMSARAAPVPGLA